MNGQFRTHEIFELFSSEHSTGSLSSAAGYRVTAQLLMNAHLVDRTRHHYDESGGRRPKNATTRKTSSEIMQILGAVQSGVEERRSFECANGSRTCPGLHPATCLEKRNVLSTRTLRTFCPLNVLSQDAQGSPIAMVWRDGTLSVLLPKAVILPSSPRTTALKTINENGGDRSPFFFSLHSPLATDN